MNVSRRQFFKASAAAGVAVSCNSFSGSATMADDMLQAEMDRSVFKKELFPEPVIIESLQLLHRDGVFYLRARSRDGAVGYSVSNEMHMAYLYPLLIKRIIPFFIGKDARQLDELLEALYRADSNYKYQGLAFWVCQATVEFALLDLLGRIAGKPMGELIGATHDRRVAAYQANNYRGKSAEESAALIEKTVRETGAKAAKFKVGGRMSKNQDDPPGRTEKLIPLVRKVLGDDITIYADSNGSYDVPNSIRVGRMLEDIRAGFFEEPCPFDHYEETRQIAEALTMPIAGGEQDSSLWLFKWMIANNALQVVQPDLFYFGGMIRCMKVARMAQAAGIPCTPHISGTGLGYLYMLHFVSVIPNAGPYHEFKGLPKNIEFTCNSSSLTPEDGVITAPDGPGLGIEFEPNFIKKLEPVAAASFPSTFINFDHANGKR